jgi:hypothetical protein
VEAGEAVIPAFGGTALSRYLRQYRTAEQALDFRRQINGSSAFLCAGSDGKSGRVPFQSAKGAQKEVRLRAPFSNSSPHPGISNRRR